MPITKLSFSNVGPFDDIEFEFDPQVNVITGPNNSGKSTALWVLGETAVFPFDFPRKLLRHAAVGFELHVQSDDAYVFTGQLPLLGWETGSNDLEDGRMASEQPFAYSAHVLEMIGFSKFIPALRRSTDFRSTGPTLAHTEQDEARRAEAEQLSSDLRKRLTLASQDASLVSDEAVIQEIIDLDYRSYLRDDPTRRGLVVQVGELASAIAEGFPIHFSGVSEDDVGFFPWFRTVDGLMPLNTLSQGTQSVVQWLARMIICYAAYYGFPETLKDKPGVLIVDEIDAHLHPSWQRRIIPTLTKYFPNLQIFCSTHSPLMLAGLKAGQVQLLQRDEDNKVTVSRNEEDVVGWSADEILRNFLGVRDPTDWETVKNLEKLRDLRRNQDLSPKDSEELERLRGEVSEGLMSGPVAAQVDRFIQALEQAKTGGDL